MEVQTIQKYIHTTPRKLRLVADMVRKMEPVRALDILRVTPKYAARDLSKALETVLANAKQAGMDPQKLAFKKIEIDESMKMRRFRSGTRGRVKPYKRRMSHIKIVVSDEIIKPEKQSVKVSADQETNKEENKNSEKPVITKLSEEKAEVKKEAK